VLISTFALLQQAHSFERTSPAIRVALSYLAVPGFSLGVIVSLIASRSVHNSSFWLAFCLGIPMNWALYYLLSVGILQLWGKRRKR
jgi:hypothetical protein